MERSLIPGVTILDTRSESFAQDFWAALNEAGAKLLCVDYFDTIVKRSVAPEHVKRIASERLARLFRMPDGGPIVYERRSNLESAIAERNTQLGRDAEFSLLELYADMWEAVETFRAIPKSDFIHRAILLETSVEATVQDVDEVLIAALKKQRELGRRVVIVSDFYIPKKQFRLMLQRHGIEQYFDALYVSCDYHLSKRTGNLYDTVLTNEGVEASAVLMVGDNPYSDIERAHSRGITPIQLDRSHRISEYEKLAKRDVNHVEIEKRLDALFSPGQASVFGELAYTLYLYIDLLFHDLARRGAKDVFFMAREGQFLLKLFETYQDQRHLRHGSGRIRSHYFKVSRRATFLPSLRPLAEEDFHVLFRQYRRISINEFLKSLGLFQRLRDLATQLPYDLDQRLEDLPTSEVFSSLLANKHFNEVYECSRVEAQKAFRLYLESFNADLDIGEVNFVDVGWKGSIQDNLRNIFDRLGQPYASLNLIGHYLGLIALGSACKRNQKLGTVFNCADRITKNFHVFNENRALFEIALGADHGSALSYALDQSISGFKLTECTFDERAMFEEKIRPLQEILYNTFCEVDELLNITNFPHERLFGSVSRHHARMVFQPTSAEIAWFENIYHVENFGVFESSTFNASNRSPSWISCIKFYMQLRKDPASVDLGFWPWLRVLQQGGRLTAQRYAMSRMKLIED